MEDQGEMYKIVTLKNVDNEDFVFQVDKVPYLLRPGEVRNFPKFMAGLAVKHLVDKILEKQDREGKLMSNPTKRADLAAQIVIGEEEYEAPVVPTAEEIVERINQPSDMDIALERNKKRLKGNEPIIPTPPITPNQTSDIPLPTPTEPVSLPVPSVPVTVSDKTSEKAVVQENQGNQPPVDGLKDSEPSPSTNSKEKDEFDGLKTPPRAEMLEYAKKTLKLDVEDKKTKAAFAKMTDVELYKELQME